jgi:hypothetical protein
MFCVIIIEHRIEHRLIQIESRHETRDEAKAAATALNGDGPRFYAVQWITRGLLARYDAGDWFEV